MKIEHNQNIYTIRNPLKKITNAFRHDTHGSSPVPSHKHHVNGHSVYTWGGLVKKSPANPPTPGSTSVTTNSDKSPASSINNLSITLPGDANLGIGSSSSIKPLKVEIPDMEKEAIGNDWMKDIQYDQSERTAKKIDKKNSPSASINSPSSNNSSLEIKPADDPENSDHVIVKIPTDATATNPKPQNTKSTPSTLDLITNKLKSIKQKAAGYQTTVDTGTASVDASKGKIVSTNSVIEALLHYAEKKTMPTSTPTSAAGTPQTASSLNPAMVDLADLSLKQLISMNGAPTVTFSMPNIDNLFDTLEGIFKPKTVHIKAGNHDPKIETTENGSSALVLGMKKLLENGPAGLGNATIDGAKRIHEYLATVEFKIEVTGGTTDMANRVNAEIKRRISDSLDDDALKCSIASAELLAKAKNKGIDRTMVIGFVCSMVLSAGLGTAYEYLARLWIKPDFIYKGRTLAELPVLDKIKAMLVDLGPSFGLEFPDAFVAMWMSGGDDEKGLGETLKDAAFASFVSGLLAAPRAVLEYVDVAAIRGGLAMLLGAEFTQIIGAMWSVPAQVNEDLGKYKLVIRDLVEQRVLESPSANVSMKKHVEQLAHELVVDHPHSGLALSSLAYGLGAATLFTVLSYTHLMTDDEERPIKSALIQPFETLAMFMSILASIYVGASMAKFSTDEQKRDLRLVEVFNAHADDKTMLTPADNRKIDRNFAARVGYYFNLPLSLIIDAVNSTAYGLRVRTTNSINNSIPYGGLPQQEPDNVV
jgi:hypothetical protein